VSSVQPQLGNHSANAVLGVLPVETSSKIRSVVSVQVHLMQLQVWFLPKQFIPAQPVMQTHL